MGRERGEGAVEKSERAKETEETTIKMKNDVLVDVPATISLTPLSVVTSHPCRRTNSRLSFPPLPFKIIGDFLNLLNRPPDRSSPSSSRSLFRAWCFLSFIPEAASFHPWNCGVHQPKGSFTLRNRLAPCYLLFKLFAFRPSLSHPLSDSGPVMRRRNMSIIF